MFCWLLNTRHPLIVIVVSFFFSPRATFLCIRFLEPSPPFPFYLSFVYLLKIKNLVIKGKVIQKKEGNLPPAFSETKSFMYEHLFWFMLLFCLHCTIRLSSRPLSNVNITSGADALRHPVFSSLSLSLSLSHSPPIYLPLFIFS
jgi:hypothetical protein